MNELCDRSTDRLTQFEVYLDLLNRFYFLTGCGKGFYSLKRRPSMRPNKRIRRAQARRNDPLGSCMDMRINQPHKFGLLAIIVIE